MKLLDDAKIPDHPYPKLRQVLCVFVEKVSAELGENLVGIYLVGSIAIGDFDLDSDIDFLVIIHTELTEANRIALQNTQKSIFSMENYPAKHLEGSFITISDLNNRNTVGKKPLDYFDNGSTTMEQVTHDNQWHVRWVLRERGICLVGPQPRALLPEIPVEEMLAEVKTSMLQRMEIFENEITRPLGFCNSRFGQSFFVLTYCRMLHSLKTGMVQSKKAGAAWAKQFVESKWIALIDQAWEERVGVRYGVKIGQRAETGLLNETLDFIKYAISQIDKHDPEVDHGNQS